MVVELFANNRQVHLVGRKHRSESMISGDAVERVTANGTLRDIVHTHICDVIAWAGRDGEGDGRP